MTALNPGDPFLKWAGGKRKSAHFLARLLPYPIPGIYHEPFLGGGALFFYLRQAGQIPPNSVVFLADRNERLARCYRAVQQDVEAVIIALAAYAKDYSEEHFYEARALQIDQQSDVRVAAWLLYMNRAAFNGLYRVNKRGEFNVSFGRYEHPNLCPAAHLRVCSKLLQGATIVGGAFRGYTPGADLSGDVFYLDPPYVPMSDTANFAAYTAAGFGPEDQVELRDTARTLVQQGATVLLSNHDTPEVRELYADFELRRLDVARAINCQASKRGKVGELAILGRPS